MARIICTVAAKIEYYESSNTFFKHFHINSILNNEVRYCQILKVLYQCYTSTIYLLIAFNS